MSTRGRSDPFAPIPLFAYPLYAGAIAGHSEHKAALLGEILALRDRSDGVVRSNRGGAWHAGEDFMAIRHPSLAWLLQNAVTFARHALAPMYQGWSRSSLELGSYWANVLPAGAWNAPHHHHPQHWSCVYYVAVPSGGGAAGGSEQEGMIEFLNPSPVQSQWGAGSYAYGPREGNLLLFPASLVHLVHPHEADEERVSIAMNFNVVPRSAGG